MRKKLWQWTGRLCDTLAIRLRWLGERLRARAEVDHEPRLAHRIVKVFEDKWTLIRTATQLQMDYGEAECGACGAVWEAAVPLGARAKLQCPYCGQFAGQFTCLVEGKH